MLLIFQQRNLLRSVFGIPERSLLDRGKGERQKEKEVRVVDMKKFPRGGILSYSKKDHPS